MPHNCTADADPEPAAGFALTRNTSTPAHLPSSRPFELAGETWKRLDIPVVDPHPVPDPVVDPNPIAPGAGDPPKPGANTPGVDPNEPDVVDPGHAPTAPAPAATPGSGVDPNEPDVVNPGTVKPTVTAPAAPAATAPTVPTNDPVATEEPHPTAPTDTVNAPGPTASTGAPPPTPDPAPGQDPAPGADPTVAGETAPGSGDSTPGNGIGTQPNDGLQGSAAQALQDAIAEGHEDYTAPSWTENYKRSAPEVVDLPSSGFKDILSPQFANSEIGLSSTTAFVRTIISSKHPHTKSINDALFSKDGKVVIAKYSMAAADTNQVSDRLTWSEFIFQQMKEFSEDQTAPYDIKNLKFIVRYQVSSPATITALKAAYQANKLDYAGGQKGKFSKDAADGTPEKQAYNALSLTDNVKGVNWLLADHHNEMGNKQIVAIHTFPDEAFDGSIFLETGNR